MNTKQNKKLKNYELISYEGYQAKHNIKRLKLSEEDAHNLNYAFALNRIPKRYVKIND